MRDQEGNNAIKRTKRQQQARWRKTEWAPVTIRLSPRVICEATGGLYTEERGMYRAMICLCI